MAQELLLSYSTWKRVVSDARLRVYYRLLTSGPNTYYAVAGASDFLYAVSLTQAPDVSDFEATLLPRAISTASEAEALAVASSLSPRAVRGGIVASDVGVNSTTTPLGAGASFTGVAEDIRSFVSITVNVTGGPDNATGTLIFEFSPDGINWDVSRAIPVSNLNIVIPFPLRVVLPFFRVRYVNDATPQTTFRLTVVYHALESGPLIRLPGDIVSGAEPIQIVRALVEPSFRGNLSLLAADRAVGGEGIVGDYVIHTLAEFDTSFASNDVAVSTSGGATAVQSAANGAVLTSAAGAGASSARVVSNRRVRYRPGREFRIEFSVGFSATGLADANELIGFSDEAGSPNRIELGYRGTVFGIHIVSAGVVTTIPKASWNGGDPLDGSALTAFRSGEIPVALDITRGNAWRIRGVWFGVGPVYLEVKSPDDFWVTAHVLRYPNTATVPYIQNPNMFPFAEIVKTASAGAGTLSMFMFCWSAGTVEDASNFEPHETHSRKLVNASTVPVTVSTTVHTVSTGRKLYVKSLHAMIRNESLVTAGRVDLIDAITGSVGTLLMSFAMATAENQSASRLTISSTMPVPLEARIGLRLVIVSGTITVAFNVQGYEKEI